MPQILAKIKFSLTFANLQSSLPVSDVIFFIFVVTGQLIGTRCITKETEVC